MRLDGIRAGDIVRCSVKGRIFHAVVRGDDVPKGLRVEPLERGISYRHVTAHDVIEHWARRGRPRAEGSRDVHPDQRSLEDLWDR